MIIANQTGAENPKMGHLIDTEKVVGTVFCLQRGLWLMLIRTALILMSSECERERKVP